MHTSGVPKCFIVENCVGLKPSIVRRIFQPGKWCSPSTGPIVFQEQVPSATSGLWACESLNAGEVASQRNARGECGLPLVFLSSCIHTKESVANCLPTNSFVYSRPLLASRTDQRTKKRIRKVSWNGTRCVIIGIASFLHLLCINGLHRFLGAFWCDVLA